MSNKDTNDVEEQQEEQNATVNVDTVGVVSGAFSLARSPPCCFEGDG